jgi:hypothetical protein
MGVSAWSPRADQTNKLDLRNPTTQARRQEVSDAHREFLEAHLAYERALSIAPDPLDSTSIIALQQAGRKYAEVILRHSHLVMEWLALVERSR